MHQAETLYGRLAISMLHFSKLEVGWEMLPQAWMVGLSGRAAEVTVMYASGTQVWPMRMCDGERGKRTVTDLLRFKEDSRLPPNTAALHLPWQQSGLRGEKILASQQFRNTVPTRNRAIKQSSKRGASMDSTSRRKPMVPHVCFTAIFQPCG